MDARKIVVIVEDVDVARTALQWTLHNFLRYGDLITLLHVFPSTRSRNRNKLRLLRLKGFQLALSFKDICNNFPNTRTEIVVTEGDVQDQGGRIATMVREIGASTLVVGLHNKSFIYKWMIALITAAIARHDWDFGCEYLLAATGCIFFSLWQHAPWTGSRRCGIRTSFIPCGMFYPGQSYRGHVLGRDRGIWTDSGHPAGRGSGMIGPSSYPRHMARGQPKTSFRRRSGGTPVWGGSQAEINFNEDFDFEAMNEKFNKEEIWGLLSKKNQQAGPVDEKVGDGRAEDRAGVPKAEHKPGYCKEDFFDSISCEALDALSEKEKTNSSEARNLVSETSGETEGPQLSHGVQEPPTGGVSPGSYGGRGYENSGRSRGKAVWNPGA